LRTATACWRGPTSTLIPSAGVYGWLVCTSKPQPAVAVSAAVRMIAAPARARRRKRVAVDCDANGTDRGTISLQEDRRIRSDVSLQPRPPGASDTWRFRCRNGPRRRVSIVIQASTEVPNGRYDPLSRSAGLQFCRRRRESLSACPKAYNDFDVKLSRDLFSASG